jgi:ribonuclease HI
METVMLFTDGSVNTQTKVGFGAYFSIIEKEFEIDSLIVNVKRFDNTSSTKLELQTLLWALNEIKVLNRKIDVYTDSQNIVRLIDRQDKLEKNNYRSKKNKLLNNYKLYQEFYKLTDKLNCEFHKVRGHLKSNQKDNIDKLFTLVDKASRKALREDNQ